MKKHIAFLLPLFLLISCDNAQSYILKEATGFDVTNIITIWVNGSFIQSYAWPWPYDDYSNLDVKYVKTNEDIQNRFFSEKSNTRAMYLHIQTNLLDSSDSSNIYLSSLFAVSQTDRYLYFIGLESNYRSQNKVSRSFINGLNIELER